MSPSSPPRVLGRVVALVASVSQAVHWAVWGAVGTATHMAVDEAVSKAVWGAVDDAGSRAVDQAVCVAVQAAVQEEVLHAPR